MVNVIVILEIDPSKIDEFLSVALENAAASREEPGCLRFEVSQDTAKPNFFALSESYTDQAAMEAHYTTPQHMPMACVSPTGASFRNPRLCGCRHLKSAPSSRLA